MTESRQQEEGPIESLTQKLYTPGDGVPEERRSGLHQNVTDVPQDWQHEHEHPKSFSLDMKLAQHHTTAKWIFLVAILFFAVSLAAAFFFLSNNRNVVSAGKIDISVTGPVSIAAGDTLPLSIDIKNRNAATLEVVDLILEYPDGTRSVHDVTNELTDYRVGLGNINPGVTVSTTTEAILFGEEGSTRDVYITIEYRIAGSGAIFVKESVFTVSIGTAPLSMTVDGPKSVNSGDEVEMLVRVRSNSSFPLENVVVRGEYPFGFTFTEADPEASYSDTLWVLGDIEPEGTREILVKGVLEGQDNEERIFHFDLGIASQQDTTTLGTSFVKAQHEVEIERPFINLTMTLNGSEAESVVAQPGTIVRGKVEWRNNLRDKLGEGVLTVKLDGSAFDESSVFVVGGFYNSSNNTITWDQQSVDDLEFINPGSRGEVNFSFNLKPSSQLGGMSTNPEVPVTARLTAIPVGEDDTEKTIRSEVRHRVMLASSVGIDTLVTYATGPIDNEGPLPPVVEEETTYTITWTVSSSVNELSGGTVRAVLPPYVSWKNEVRPSTENVTYTASSREVLWTVGDVLAGAGYNKAPRKVSFQVGMTPSAPQVGSAPELIGDSIFSALDEFIGGEIGDVESAANIHLEEDGAPVNHDRVLAAE